MIFEQDKLTIYNDDCMSIMSFYEDNYFDLAIVDPPYGISICETGYAHSKSRKVKQKNGITIEVKKNNYGLFEDVKPEPEYFQELFRVSKNQIIWGGNHLAELIGKNSPCWIVWDKVNGSSSFADCELAWTSLGTAVRKFTYMWSGMLQGSSKNGSIAEGNKRKHEKRIHATQKPVRLYNWLYQNYAKPGMKVLDTHLGSGSNAIAAHYAKMGEFIGCEIDGNHFKNSIEWIHKDTRQLELF